MTFNNQYYPNTNKALLLTNWAIFVENLYKIWLKIGVSPY